MNKNSWLGAALVACFLAAPAFALHEGLYLVDGTSDYYFVDQSGARHLVQDFPSVKPRWFANTPVVTTKTDLIGTLPLGDVITTTVGPDMVIKKTTTTTTVNESTPLSRGLYMVDGSSDYYFIDENGVRHLVQGYDQVKSRWFSSMPVNKTRLEIIQGLPPGDVITETVGPDMVVRKKTTTTTDDDGVSRSTTTKTEETTEQR